MNDEYELEQWTISGGADFEQVHALVACAAEKLGLPTPGPERTVDIPRRLHDDFRRALDECDENWTEKGLAPPERQ